MALGQPHVCITHPCEFCRVTAGGAEGEGNRSSHRVVAFFPRVKQARPSGDCLAERLALLSPSQLRIVEALMDLYLD
jgi:hypothetical protein